jgi:hypothetical protein
MTEAMPVPPDVRSEILGLMQSGSPDPWPLRGSKRTIAQPRMKASRKAHRQVCSDTPEASCISFAEPSAVSDGTAAASANGLLRRRRRAG